MDDESHADHGDHLTAFRDLNPFLLNILTADSKARAAEVFQWYEITEVEFVKYFPEYAKRVQGLPGDTP
ncbi:hypothetical protein GT030_23505 [Streptomyces sp. SID1328]|uniref:hypothetical protein n=1 Tax=Streptomyces sp. SID1328 TaxID=2690250 RepID=UPI00136C2415|nr:hypothetical protein [Streptomyces sp. SID1328]MYV41751.1 hypothetical protein [Streptomyces sp. SID1328]